MVSRAGKFIVLRLKVRLDVLLALCMYAVDFEKRVHSANASRKWVSMLAKIPDITGYKTHTGCIVRSAIGQHWDATNYVVHRTHCHVNHVLCSTLEYNTRQSGCYVVH